MARLQSNNPFRGVASGQTPAVATVKTEDGAAPQTTAQGQGHGQGHGQGQGLPVAKNYQGGVIQNNIAPITPRGGGFGLTFPMEDDIHSTGGQGLTIVSGLPNVPSIYGPHLPDIVQQAVPTQYKRAIGMDFDFDLPMKELDARAYEQDVKDHGEYDFVGNDSHEDLLAQSEADQAEMTSFSKARQVFTRWMHVPRRSKASKEPYRYRLA